MRLRGVGRPMLIVRHRVQSSRSHSFTPEYVLNFVANSSGDNKGCDEVGDVFRIRCCSCWCCSHMAETAK
jgi:hypothetical protein